RWAQPADAGCAATREGPQKRRGAGGGHPRRRNRLHVPPAPNQRGAPRPPSNDPHRTGAGELKRDPDGAVFRITSGRAPIREPAHNLSNISIAYFVPGRGRKSVYTCV